MEFVISWVWVSWVWVKSFFEPTSPLLGGSLYTKHMVNICVWWLLIYKTHGEYMTTDNCNNRKQGEHETVNSPFKVATELTGPDLYHWMMIKL